MNTATEETKSLALIVVGDASITPAKMFEPGAMDSILDRIKAEVRAIDTDISTDAGRKAIKSLDRKIARSKTFIDAKRQELVGDRKKELALIDKEGARAWKELEALQEEVYQPLKEWEDAEKARIAENERRIEAITRIFTVMPLGSIHAVEMASLELDELTDFTFSLEFRQRVSTAREKAALHLQAEAKRIKQAEAEKAEKARLKAEADEKARLAREAEIAETARKEAEAKAKEREEEQARIAKQREDELLRVAAEEKAEQARAAKKREDDAERERKASESRLQKSLDDARAKTKAAEDQREQDRQRAEDERERAVADERKRIADERKAEEQRKKDADAEEERRKADKDHRAKVHKDAFDAMVAQVPDLNTDCARNIVRAISKGLIPGLSFNY
jgi:hypothetical protein